MSDSHFHPADIAVIGMAARFPDAGNVEEYWQNLLAGKCSTRSYSHQALRLAGVKEEEFATGDYIGVTAQIDDVEYFDPAFFGLNQRDAEIMDPQFRHFFEVAWLALEDAGLAHGRSNHTGVFSACGMGLYSGKSMNNYFRVNIEPNARVMENLDPIQAKILTEREYLPTQLCYRLNLTGPGCAVNTACSSALVAIHQAVQSLLCGECDTALAGASAIHAPHIAGYRYNVGSIFSPEGACRPFDASASGIVGGNGVGVVVLKKRELAELDGDRIYAVIKGSAINNDGAQKVSYTAPGVEGQKRNLHRALAISGIDVNAIGLIEAHGTGTALGDPVELGMFQQVFRELGYSSAQKVTVGSVKSNLGHLDTAAGMAAFIKTVCAVRAGQKPATVGFNVANPALLLDGASPFSVSGVTQTWDAVEQDRHAIVCALGAGGTNAHIVLSGYAQLEIAGQTPEDHDAYAVLCLSGHSANALEANKQAMARYLAATDYPLAAISYSLAEKRSFMEHRCVVFGRTREELIARLVDDEPEGRVTGVKKRRAAEQATGTFALNLQGQLTEPTQWQALGQALVEGTISPRAIWQQASRRTVPLPGYCFDRVRCWVDVPQPQAEGLPLRRYCWQPGVALAGSPVAVDRLMVDRLQEDGTAWLQSLCIGQAAGALILHECADSQHPIAAQLAAVGRFLHQLDEVAPRGLPLLFVSQQAALVGHEPGAATARGGAIIWAAIKAAATELVNVSVHWLDVTPDVQIAQLAQVAALLPESKGTERALRGGVLYQLIMQPIEDSAIGGLSTFTEQDAVVLIGGRGGIGQRLLAHYAARDARQLFVVSRQPPDAAMQQHIARLAAQAVSLHWIEGDATQETVWSVLENRLRAAGCRLKVLCHLAGVLADAPLSVLTEQDIQRVLKPKLGVCEQIALHFERLQPKQILLFSSLSAAFGSPAQFAYAAANAALDSWAENLHRRGVNVCAVQWGPWAGGGMAQLGTAGTVGHNSSRLKPIDPGEGFAALERLQQLSEPLALASWLPEAADTDNLTRIQLAEAIFAPANPVTAGSKSQPPVDNQALISTIVREMAGIASDDREFIHMPFSALGLDSLAITQLRKRVASGGQISLSISELYNYPTVAALCDYLQQKSEPGNAQSGPITGRDEAARRRLVSEICQFFPEATER